MTVAVITLALVVLTLTGVVAWLARGWIGEVRAHADTDKNLALQAAELTKATAALDAANAANASAAHDLAASQEAALDAPIPADALPAGDVDSRLLQAAQADAADRQVHPRPAAGVHPAGAAAGTEAADVRPLAADGKLDPDELLR